MEGFPGKSKKGELSIFPRALAVLAPCLHMLPKRGIQNQARAPLPAAQGRGARMRQVFLLEGTGLSLRKEKWLARKVEREPGLVCSGHGLCPAHSSRRSAILLEHARGALVGVYSSGMACCCQS